MFRNMQERASFTHSSQLALMLFCTDCEISHERFQCIIISHTISMVFTIR